MWIGIGRYLSFVIPECFYRESRTCKSGPPIKTFGGDEYCLLALCVLVILFPIKLFAEDTSFQATVNSNKVSLQDVVELTLTVHGVKGDVPMINLPALDGFEARFVGPSTKLTIINGVTSNEHSFIYNLFPSKVGHFQIPSLSLTLDGQTYHTGPMDIEVTSPSAQPANPPGGNQTEETINDKVFMVASVSPQQVYVGQKTKLQIKVYVKDLSLQLAAAPSLIPNGFTADTSATMNKTKEIVNGMSYEALQFETNIYPTRAGDMMVGPLQVNGDLIYRTKQNDDFFGDLFATEQRRPIALHASAVPLHVLSLPSAPADFSGAVGPYDFKASVGPAVGGAGPTAVKVGDPLTLHMSLTGRGRIKGVTLPAFVNSQFKIYDPQVKEDENSKTIEQVIIPTSQNITEVPAVSFSYFDPQEGQYRTMTQGPFPIKVLAQAPGQEFKAWGFVDKTKMAAEKPFVVKFDWVQKLATQALHRAKVTVRNWKFWVLISLAGLAWLSWKIWQKFQLRLANDQAFARRWRADSKAKGLFKQTRIYLQQNNPKEFYSCLHKTLNDYLADKMHLPPAGLTLHLVETRLKDISVDPAKLEIIKNLFDRCDLARFASARVSLDEMTGDFKKLEELIGYLSKILK